MNETQQDTLLWALGRLLDQIDVLQQLLESLQRRVSQLEAKRPEAEAKRFG